MRSRYRALVAGGGRALGQEDVGFVAQGDDVRVGTRIPRSPAGARHAERGLCASPIVRIIAVWAATSEGASVHLYAVRGTTRTWPGRGRLDGRECVAQVIGPLMKRPAILP